MSANTETVYNSEIDTEEYGEVPVKIILDYDDLSIKFCADEPYYYEYYEEKFESEEEFIKTINCNNSSSLRHWYDYAKDCVGAYYDASYCGPKQDYTNVF